MGRETASFFPSGAPQDLGGAQQPLLEHPSSRKRPSWRTCLTDGNRLGKLLVIICCALLVLGFLGKVLSYVSRHHGMPNMPDDAHARPRPVNCPGTIYRSKDERNFSTIQNLSLVQRKTQNKGRWSVHVTGQVLVQKTDKNDKLNVNVEYRTNIESLLQEIALRPVGQDSEDDGALELWVPESSNERTVPWNSPCLDIDVVISVPSGASFESFYLSLKTLDIVFGDLSYAASSTSLETQTGSVRFASTSHVSSRVIRIHVGTGSVKGTYPLLDLLDVQTQTGSIDVTVTPQEADEQRLPAKMRISSNTGSIRVAAALEDLPERDYQTTIQSGTSSIHVGPLMHGSHTGLHARTASIQGTLTPVGSLDEISAIEATSTTGSVTMNIAPHRKHPKKAMRHLNGKYSSHTGRVELTHPLQWEGTVRADSQTGSVRVNWPGLSGSGDHGEGFLGIKLPGSSFEGNKGKGDALVVAHSGTGSVELNGRDIS